MDANPIAPTMSLRLSAWWTLLGNLCARGSQWGLLAVIGHQQQLHHLGQLGLAMSICTPVIMFANLQLGPVLAADAQQRYAFAQYSRLRLIATSLATVFVIAGCAIAAFWKVNLDLLVVIALVALNKLLEAWSDLLQNRLRQYDRSDTLAASMAARGILTLAAFALAYTQSSSLTFALLCMATASLACLLAVEIPLLGRTATVRAIVASVSWQPMVDLAKKTLPLGGISLLIALFFATPSYFLELFHSTKEVGVFFAIASLPVAAEMLVRSTSQASLPRLGALFAQHDAKGFFDLHARVMKLYFATGLLGLVVTLAAGQWILRLALGAELSNYTSLLNLMMAALAISYLGLAGPLFLAAEKYSKFLLTWVVALATLVLGCVLLIPTWGIYGAAWAVLTANTVRAIAVHCAISWWIKPLLTSQAEPAGLQAAA